MVLATQNPVETEGTYPLPEAQLDRFLFKIRIDYPEAADEANVVRLATFNRTGDELPLGGVQRVLETAQVLALQALTAQQRVDDQVVEYATRLATGDTRLAGTLDGSRHARCAGAGAGRTRCRAARWTLVRHSG